MRSHFNAVSLVALLAAAPAAAAETAPRPPTSEAERALDAALTRSGHDDDFLDNIFQGRGAKKFRPKIDYGATLTPALLAALRAKEVAAVRSNCKGRYRKGEICGMDYNPLTCAQDDAVGYRYRTDADDGATARIAYFWPDQTEAAARFKLVKEAGRWRLDGVACTEGDPVNM